MNFWILDDMKYEQSYNVMHIAGRARQAGKTEMLTAWYKQTIEELCKIAKETNVPIITATQKSLDLGEQCLAQDYLASILKGIDFSKPAQTEAIKPCGYDFTNSLLEDYLNEIKAIEMKELWKRMMSETVWYGTTKERTMKYKIGDRVRVVSLEDTRKYRNISECAFIDPMEDFCDKVVTISEIRGYNTYRVKESAMWNWKEEYFVGLAEEKKEKTMTKQELLDKIAKLKKEQQEIEAQIKKLPKYPCIKRHMTSKIVVLFTKERTGTVIFSSNPYIPLGKYDTTWYEEFFTTEYNAFTVKVGE